MRERPTFDFDLRQLEVLRAVIEHQSFTKAAKVVHLSQASVSERIATLERVTGATLLNRRGGSITPTKPGLLLYEHAVRILELKRRASLELAELLGLERGILKLGGSTIPGEFILPSVIAQFRQRFPGVAVEVEIADSSAIVDRVVAGDLELGIVGSKPFGSKLTSKTLWHDQLALVVHRDHPWASLSSVSLDTLCGESFIIREPGSGTRRALELHLGTSLDSCKVVAQLGSSTAVKEGLKHGLGVSILSRLAVASELDSGELVEVALAELELERDFFLIYDERREQSPACDAFVTFLEQLDDTP